MSAQFPSPIRVGWADYVVEVWPSREANGQGKYGEVCHQSGVIRVADDMPPMQTANTLLHEVLHCIYTAYELDDEDKEERIVVVMANGLTQVWRDNPGLVAFLNASLK